MTSFEAISERTGIPLPPMFSQWLAGGLTRYGDDWAEIWRERMVNSPPALASVWDFEWITADAAQMELEEWLNPDHQGGTRFLPFGCSGAGDCYSLIPVGDDVVAVAWIAHDSGKVRWCGRSFAGFACLKAIEACTDRDYLLDCGLSQAEAARCLLADLSNVSKALPPEYASRLQPVIARLEMSQGGGQSDEAVEPFDDRELARLSASFSTVGLPELTCVPRWQCA